MNDSDQLFDDSDENNFDNRESLTSLIEKKERENDDVIGVDIENIIEYSKKGEENDDISLSLEDEKENNRSNKIYAQNFYSKKPKNSLGWRLEIVVNEIITILRLAVPIMITYFCSMFIGIVSLMFVGHLGVNELAGSALGNMICNISGYSIIIGLLSGYDTVASQAFGAKEYKKLGIFAQRSVIICAVAVIPISIVWFFYRRYSNFTSSR
eukprot:TRINITY_DN11509_c0_g1_i1.p1 TRINITY_DN11509_c0_g1~~TRINITY_DN11509_c0_g1_i1.p1  ORF type:complete len:211 (+),score=49.81 TRINITY_DN11509_c0_g1_i1:94-726(+)